VSTKKRLVVSLCSSFLFTLLVSSTFAAEILVKFDNIREEKIYMQGFTVEKATEVQIEAVGAKGRSDDYMVATGWIIDADTRELVWALTVDNSSPSRRNHGKREAEAKIALSPGDYEAYYFAGQHYYLDIKIRGTGDLFDFLGDLFSGEMSRDWDRLLEEFKMEIKVEDRFKATPNDKKYQLLKGLIEFTEIGDSFYGEAGCTLKKPSRLRLYALGEYSESDRVMVDYGWIKNARTRETVWEMDRWNTAHAGGAEKNRVFDGQIELPAGDYLVYYATDDSHSEEKFNATPPYDPYAWGLVLAGAKEGFNRTDFETSTPKEIGTALIEMTRVGDDEYRSQGFTLKRGMSLHLYCLGEYSRGDREMADYGWIEEYKSGRKVWEMTPENSRHGGGAAKNRVFDGVVELPAGDYVVFYLSDDSHSYRDWNDAPPFNPQSWGTTIASLDEKFDNKNFQLFEEAKKEGPYLVQMICLGDDVKKKEYFKLDKPTTVHIYAIGEGDNSEMYDYGWIENKKSGKVVWEMTYRMTEHAGGAKKNRVFDDSVILDKGEYTVYFVTDGSHSFEDWNAARPRDPSHWGITIRETK
jgi:hypothetical protein